MPHPVARDDEGKVVAQAPIEGPPPLFPVRCAPGLRHLHACGTPGLVVGPQGGGRCKQAAAGAAEPRCPCVAAPCCILLQPIPDELFPELPSEVPPQTERQLVRGCTLSLGSCLAGAASLQWGAGAAAASRACSCMC